MATSMIRTRITTSPAAVVPRSAVAISWPSGIGDYSPRAPKRERRGNAAGIIGSDNHLLFQYQMPGSPRQEARAPEAGSDNPRLSLLGSNIEKLPYGAT